MGWPTGIEPVKRGPQPLVLPLHHGHHRALSMRDQEEAGNEKEYTEKICNSQRLFQKEIGDDNDN